MVWITSPAGTGKSTVLAKFIDTIEDPSYWFNFSELDSHSEIFCQNFKEMFPRTTKPISYLDTN